MSGLLSRRQWFYTFPGTYAALSGTQVVLGALDTPVTGSTLHDEFPAQDSSIVRDVVGASHFNFDRVRELVEASPALAKANWDWGFGDWESALGAASHTGRADIATLLISHGARPNLFTLAMLGKVDAVRACVTAVPGIQRVPGPHGITLLQHARNGGDDARTVVEYLESLGDADPIAISLDMTDATKATYLGRYTFGNREDEILEIMNDRRGDLAIVRTGRTARRLHRVEEHGFAPAGAPAVRIRFHIADGRASAVTIHDPHPVITARRMD
jgi:hypothetical protein